jgi:hypothetical protein
LYHFFQKAHFLSREELENFLPNCWRSLLNPAQRGTTVGGPPNQKHKSCRKASHHFRVWLDTKGRQSAEIWKPHVKLLVKKF